MRNGGSTSLSSELALFHRQRKDALVDGDSIEDRQDVYADQAARLIILNLPIPQFIWAQGILERYRGRVQCRSADDVPVRVE